MPMHPEFVYRTEGKWKGWNDFLGAACRDETEQDVLEDKVRKGTAPPFCGVCVCVCVVENRARQCLKIVMGMCVVCVVCVINGARVVRQCSTWYSRPPVVIYSRMCTTAFPAFPASQPPLTSSPNAPQPQAWIMYVQDMYAKYTSECAASGASEAATVTCNE